MKIEAVYNLFMLEQDFRNNTEKTLIWYRESLSAFINWLGSDSDVEDLTLVNYKSYCSYLLHTYEHNGKKLESSSVNSYVRAVKAFYNFCIEEDYIPDFSRKLRTTKVIKKEKKILTDEEIKILLGSFGSGVLEERNRCWTVLMFDSGLRRGEVLGLKISDFDLENRCLLVFGKGRKYRFVPLGDLSYKMLCDFISAYRAGTAANDYIFVNRFGEKCSDNSIKQVFQKLKNRTGIERLHPHLLRHTFATNYLLDGGDIETLRIILGHSDLQITQVYLHMASNIKMITQRHKSHYDLIFDRKG